MKILIVDDEPPARARLHHLVHEAALGRVVGEASDGHEALRACAELGPDIILLDIRMPGMDGLEVAGHLARLEHPPAVIFTTAYDNHALAAFETNAVDYLLKPIRRERLAAAVERARRPTLAQLDALRQSSMDTASERTHISARLSNRLELVPVESIRFFRADQKYVIARYPQGQALIEDPLSMLAEEFGERFLRVHRNALVAREHVRALEKDRNGRTVVRLADIPEPVEVSRRLSASVRKVLKG